MTVAINIITARGAACVCPFFHRQYPIKPKSIPNINVTKCDGSIFILFSLTDKVLDGGEGFIMTSTFTKVMFVVPFM